MTEYERKLELFDNTALASISTNNEEMNGIWKEEIPSGKKHPDTNLEDFVFIAKAMIAELDKHKENG